MSGTIRNLHHASYFRSIRRNGAVKGEVRNKALPPNPHFDFKISALSEDWWWSKNYGSDVEALTEESEEAKTPAFFNNHLSKKNKRKAYDLARNLKSFNYEETL